MAAVSDEEVKLSVLEACLRVCIGGLGAHQMQGDLCMEALAYLSLKSMFKPLILS
jgi:hypothetical protein